MNSVTGAVIIYRNIWVLVNSAGGKMQTNEEYIKRKSALEQSCVLHSYLQNGVNAVTVKAIEEIPAEDVAPVRHSFWELIGECKYGNKVVMSRCRCVKCGFIHWFADNHFGQYMFCPQCGARMDGDE